MLRSIASQGEWSIVLCRPIPRNRLSKSPCMCDRKRGIFKIETVGDCYVAAAGVPEPRSDHAVAMARFASDCVANMATLTKQLEVELGPDTASLGIRVGKSGYLSRLALRCGYSSSLLVCVCVIFLLQRHAQWCGYSWCTSGRACTISGRYSRCGYNQKRMSKGCAKLKFSLAAALWRYDEYSSAHRINRTKEPSARQ